MSTPTDPTAGEGLSKDERVTLNLGIDEAETCVCCGGDYGSKHVYAAVERIIAAQQSAAATRARAEALREAAVLAEKWESWSRVRSTPRIDAFRDAAEELRAVLSLAPDTAGESA